MMFRASILLVLWLCSSSRYADGAVDIPGVKTTETFTHSSILDADGKFILFWNYNDTHITFEAHVRTKGWVGLGLSGNGKMFPADVTVGWILDDGTVKFSDRHTTGHSPPVMDSSQDWTLLYGEENEFGTVLKMVRKLRTCDAQNDQDIEDGTNRMIFAYGDSDPADDNSISYHSTKRGTKSLSLLSAAQEKVVKEQDTQHYDFLNNNYFVPNDTTTYWCRSMQMPPIGRRHMVKFEPIVTPGNELNVHHIVLYRCNLTDPDSYDGLEQKCDDMWKKLSTCKDIVLAWAIGGEPFYFPDNVGFPMGGPDDGSFFIMETHFDNPTRRTNMIDNSGIRITLTSKLRQHEAGLLELGVGVSPFQVIPPGEKDFVSKGYCHEDCLKKSFQQSSLSEIKIIGALQHSHLLGVAITTRHYRNGVELKPLIADPHYDFDFQEVRMLQTEVPVYPGDSFRVDCHYDSTGRIGPTLGGLSTQEEMCITFAYYYPRMPLVHCVSVSILDYFKISDPAQLYRYIASLDWSNSTATEYAKTGIEHSQVYQECGGHNLESSNSTTPWIYMPTEPIQHYTPPTPDCS